MCGGLGGWRLPCAQHKWVAAASGRNYESLGHILQAAKGIKRRSRQLYLKQQKLSKSDGHEEHSATNIVTCLLCGRQHKAVLGTQGQRWPDPSSPRWAPGEGDRKIWAHTHWEASRTLLWEDEGETLACVSVHKGNFQKKETQLRRMESISQVMVER